MKADLTLHPTYVIKNYDMETGAFEVWYNDGKLADDQWYGPINLDLDTMRPENEEPLHFQIANRVIGQVQRSQLAECNMDSTKAVLANMLGQEQEVDVMSCIKHEEEMRKIDSPSVDPICTQTQIMNIYSEDDFDEQFEALSSELAEE